MIEDESAPYDMRIHSNSSALAWTKFFREHNPECNLDDNVMLGWFANAMMAMHDHIYQSTQPEQTEQISELIAVNIKLREDLREGISLRDHFASLAMQGLIALNTFKMGLIVAMSYDTADLMLAEREKNEN